MKKTLKNMTILPFQILATGDSYTTLLPAAIALVWVVSTVAGIISETCDAIWSALQPLYMPSPAKQDCLQIASEFETRWNFPNCVGAVDGKHVVIKSPANSGSIFLKYKGTFSIVLLAVVDANNNRWTTVRVVATTLIPFHEY